MTSNLIAKGLVGCLILSAFIGCNSTDWSKDYLIKRAAIKEVNRRHWGKGYFIETMVFEYSINEQTYQNKYESNKKEYNYTSSYTVGDSLIFKYRPDNPNEIKVIKSKRMKK